jgi:hypothetical protein
MYAGRKRSCRTEGADTVVAVDLFVDAEQHGAEHAVGDHLVEALLGQIVDRARAVIRADDVGVGVGLGDADTLGDGDRVGDGVSAGVGVGVGVGGGGGQGSPIWLPLLSQCSSADTGEASIGASKSNVAAVNAADTMKR